MCKPISCIVTRDGDIKYNLWTHSHEDLIRIFKLNDTATPRGEPRFARIEFCPDNTLDMGDLSKYKLTIDEERCPEWFDDKMKEKVTDRMKLIVSEIIISGDADILCGGVYILAKGAKISCLKNAMVLVMCESSKVGVMRENSKVGVMRESSKVGVMRESSNVGVMRESSKVGVMRESSNVGVNNSNQKLPNK